MQQLNLSIEALERIIDWYHVYMCRVKSDGWHAQDIIISLTKDQVENNIRLLSLIEKYVEVNKCNQEGSNTGSTSSTE